ncbi:MAG: 50S ribosomal protein L17 [candidate division NC10 bacterium]|nr:50S ribosomal protein L17 [candidate division NC10 bacterium]
MRHQKARRKLGRTSSHRQALLRNLVTSLLMHERIITTEAKAKELRRIAEKMITLAKREDLHARRQAAKIIMDESVLKKLFDSLGARFAKRSGGYTRITKLSYRVGDGAPLAAIELLDQEGQKAEVSVTEKVKKALRRPRRGQKEGDKEKEKEKPEAKESKSEKQEGKGRLKEGRRRRPRPPRQKERPSGGEQSAEQAITP